MTLDLNTLRQRFPILQQKINGQPLIYLDNAATTQKPDSVIAAIEAYYSGYNANVHRAAHSLSERATTTFEGARNKVARFLNAQHSREIIWTRGTTEGVNLIAQSFARPRLQPGDEILLSEMEHHANIVPWQIVAQQTGAIIRVIPILDNGDLDLASLNNLLNSKTRILSITHISNTLGSINPIAGIIRQAKQAGATVIIDGAQAVSHLEIDVQRLGCDFYLFSGHKLFGPTGIGALYGKQELLEQMPPWQGGGEMIKKVSFSGTSYNELPFKFEAGTPNIAGAIGLGAALDFLNQLDRKQLASHERHLTSHALKLCQDIKGFQRIGNPTAHTSILSFQLSSHHQQDVGLMLDQQGIAVRTGHHCCMPLMERLGLPGTIRASFSCYNTTDEVERFAQALEQISKGGSFTSSATVTSDEIFNKNPFGNEITSEQIVMQLSPIKGWNDRYREIMQLSKQLPAMTSAMKLPENLITGCESHAWLAWKKDNDDKLWFAVDSDARIIRGLIGLTLAALNGKNPQQILAFDIEQYFSELQLLRHLSPSRGNGLRAIVDQIRKIATQQSG
ncbi:SufS family cysteine desulfurase [Amphritea sp. HPY]|uniref:SufS family cysteine desulfurase n=1 Tax=Amphritea sp. HPY TaxID=3421652 RepID=UPI003D7D73BF